MVLCFVHENLICKLSTSRIVRLLQGALLLPRIHIVQRIAQNRGHGDQDAGKVEGVIVALRGIVQHTCNMRATKLMKGCKLFARDAIIECNIYRQLVRQPRPPDPGTTSEFRTHLSASPSPSDPQQSAIATPRNKLTNGQTKKKKNTRHKHLTFFSLHQLKMRVPTDCHAENRRKRELITL